jgi:hypothetical protein
MNMLVDKINLVVNKIKTNTDAGVLKVYYEYSLLELNSVAPVVFNQLNSYPIRLYQIQREAKFYETDLGLVDLYTLDLYKPYDKKGKITDIIYSSDIYYRNAVLSMALAVQAGDESYKSLIKREDLGLPLVKTLKYFIKPEDSLYGAILRFLANVIGYNRTKRDIPNLKMVSLDTIYNESDIIVLAIALNDETLNMINIDAFKKMKKKPYIINSARGGLINNDDLLYALKNGLIKGIGIDTYNPEPIDLNDEILKYNTIVLPHIGANTNEALDDMGLRLYDNLMNVLNGKNIDDLL